MWKKDDFAQFQRRRIVADYIQAWVYREKEKMDYLYKTDSLNFCATSQTQSRLVIYVLPLYQVISIFIRFFWSY